MILRLFILFVLVLETIVLGAGDMAFLYLIIESIIRVILWFLVGTYV